MSHDRGCPCGKEKYEYDDCVQMYCPKKDKNPCNVKFDGLSAHNGEYWYKCETCGASDWCSYGDKFEQNKPLRDCKMGSRSFNTTKSASSPKKYVWIKEGEYPRIVEDLAELYKTKEFNQEKDGLFEIGAEVKLKLEVKVEPANQFTVVHKGK